MQGIVAAISLFAGDSIKHKTTLDLTRRGHAYIDYYRRLPTFHPTNRGQRNQKVQASTTRLAILSPISNPRSVRDPIHEIVIDHLGNQSAWGWQIHFRLAVNRLDFCKVIKVVVELLHWSGNGGSKKPGVSNSPSKLITLVERRCWSGDGSCNRCGQDGRGRYECCDSNGKQDGSKFVGSPAEEADKSWDGLLKGDE